MNEKFNSPAILSFLLYTLFLVRAEAASWQPTTVPTAHVSVSATQVYYRCFIRVPDNMTARADVDLWADSTMLGFADFPGPFTVFVNGQTIAKGDSIPSGPRRRFKLPKGILEKKAFNVLAVKLENDAATVGIRVPPVLINYHDELVLEGSWELLSGIPEVNDLRAVTNRPPRASFTEANFREASTILGPNEDLVRGDRLPPAESLARMRTPPDLLVDLMLHEPLVAQPTHFSFDARGRLWVAQYRQYPYPAGVKMVSRDKYYRSTFDRVPPAPPYHDKGRDVISVHEDTDGDGVFDHHRQVLTGLNMANAVLHGAGGIWVMHTPYLLFYPDANGDDQPDGDPEVRLAGFGLEDTHSIANGLAWGPDGWIYGAQGSTTTSHIRRPGLDSPDKPGVYYESCMVWRYHPETRAYEIFAEGGGNNFGLEFDAEGRLYTGHNGGETRGWHYVQSGIYLKQGKDPGKFGPPTNPYAFGELRMMMTTDKIKRFSHHFAIAEGTALPTKYRSQLVSVDPLHHNLVLSARHASGSTFTTTDTGFALEGEDKAFRPVFVANGPDGAIYVADFYEEYIAHGQNYQGQIDPDSGRIYRLRGKNSSLEQDVNLSRKTSGELIALLGHSNKWHRQTAARLLGERRDPAAKKPLLETLQNTNTHPALEALWALHQAKWFENGSALLALEHPSAQVRAWAVRLMGDQKKLSDGFLQKVTTMIGTEPDAEVRCQVASTARRLPAAQALPLVTALIKRDVDASDAYIPLLCWWTLEGFCAELPGDVLNAVDETIWKSKLAETHILPRLMQRFAGEGTRASFGLCARLLKAAPTEQHRALLVAAFEEAFKGRAIPILPDELISGLGQSGSSSVVLRLRSGDKAATAQAVAAISDRKAKRNERLLLIRTLGELSEPTAAPALLDAVKHESDLDLRKAALAALTRYDQPAIGTEICAAYTNLPASLHPGAQNLLTSRPAWALAFLKLIESGTVKRSSVSPETIVRMQKANDKTISELANKIFRKAESNDNPDARSAIEKLERVLRTGTGNPYAGETLFAERCASCHQLFHKGGRIGPNLTHYQRDDLGTMLPSIIDPNAEIREGFMNFNVETKDGRSLSGFIADQDAHVVILRGFDGEDITLARKEIAEMSPSGISLMPPGLLDGLTDQQLRDFFAYLRIPQPISK